MKKTKKKIQLIVKSYVSNVPKAGVYPAPIFGAGFTLVEIMIGLVIFAIIGVVSLSILFMTLRVGNKSDLLVILKQNGNAAVSQVSKNIRYAKSLDSLTTCVTPVTAQSVTVTSLLDNEQSTFSCTSTAPFTIASNGASLIDTSIASVTDCSFTCTQTTLNDPPTITLSFKLNARNSNSLAEKTGIIPFTASVTMRNYSK